MKIIKVRDYEEMSNVASNIIIEKIQKNPHLNIGYATGGTPVGTYKKMIEAYKEGVISFKDTVGFNLDEYVGLEQSHNQSYYYFMLHTFFKHVDINIGNTDIPNGMKTDLEQECLQYEEKIKEKNGIDFQILGIGTNGHIGFNEPGTPFEQKTHVVKLDESTREANARFFNHINEVPTHAVTMGLASIVESKEILLLISGKNKQEAVKKLLSGNVTEDFPASILHNHSKVTVIIDEDAYPDF